MKRIIVLGAGYAGVLTAKKLAKQCKKLEDVEITIIDKNPFHTMLTELHEVAAGRVEEDSIRMNLRKIFAGRKVKVVLDQITSLSFEEKKVVGSQGEYAYDYLVLAAGSKPTYFGIKGAEENAFKLWSYKDAILLKDRIHDCFRKAASQADLEEKKRLLTFYVVGSGFTGVEMVGELAEYVPVLCEEYDIDPFLVRMVNVDVLERVVPLFPEKVSGKVSRRLEKMGVELLMETGVSDIGPDYIELDQMGTKNRRPAGTVIWAAGIESADINQAAAKNLEAAKKGRIWVDAYLRARGRQDIYVVGDAMMFVPEGEQQPVPQMVENCEQSSGVAAHNIYSAITGSKPMKEYKPSFHGGMVSVGGRYGVARVGLPGHMVNLPSFFAMLSKHLINIIYFIQVLGWNKVAGYVKHEFFTVRHRRSFLGGHFSNRTPSFLLVPLRVWLGGVWIFEGVMKIVEGWFGQPMLTGFFASSNLMFQQILAKYGVGSVTVDAVSSATATAGDAAVNGVAVFSVNILGLFNANLVSAMDLAHSSLSFYAMKLDMPLMNRFLDTFVLSSDGMQLFMQRAIVVTEIIIGLSLIGGLFTFLSSSVSLVLQFMFICTTGLYLNTFWMIFAAVAVLIGSGHTMGLDYYAIPWLKKKWRKLPLIRKWYLYND